MSNFEHWIKEDSTEFEKAFLKTYDGNLWTALEKMKDWQPPKELVEVPQYVADWFKNNDDDLNFKIWGYLINWKLQDKKSDFFRWMKNETECIEILIRMQDGYTVKKEQLYEVVFSENEEGDRYLLLESDGFFIDLESMNDGYYKQQFTEAEIKAIDERYLAFAVKVDEVDQ